MTLKTKVIGLSSRRFSTLHNKKKRIAKSRIRERLPSLNEDIGMDNRTLQRALETRRQIVRQTVSLASAARLWLCLSPVPPMEGAEMCALKRIVAAAAALWLLLCSVDVIAQPRDL